KHGKYFFYKQRRRAVIVVNNNTEYVFFSFFRSLVTGITPCTIDSATLHPHIVDLRQRALKSRPPGSCPCVPQYFYQGLRSDPVLWRKPAAILDMHSRFVN